MEQLKALKAEIQALEKNAKTLMDQQHPDKPFYNARENVQRGKFIAYGHIISLIDKSINQSK